MTISRYSLPSEQSLRIAIASDYHSNKRKESGLPYVELIRKEKPDIIAVPGDIFTDADTLDLEDSVNYDGVAFLRKCTAIAPVFYSIGNHEHSLSESNKKKLIQSGITVLENDYVSYNGINIGGLALSYRLTQAKRPICPPPDPEFLRKFSSTAGYKILLCHHPDYWNKYICKYPIDLTISGHAHGGQIQLFGRGLYAPGQGVLPHYTHGIHSDGSNPTRSLVISRGMTNTVPIPRLFNPCEIVMLDIGG